MIEGKTCREAAAAVSRLYECSRLIYLRRRSTANETSCYHLLDVTHCQVVLDGGRYRQRVDTGEQRDWKAAADGVSTERLEWWRAGGGESQGEQDVSVIDEVEDDTVTQQ